jgi:hypothetical protein
LKNKFVWIENIKSFSGRNKIRGESAVGNMLWFPDFFAESDTLLGITHGEKVYHLLNLERILGRSVVATECFKTKYKSKTQKRVAYFESISKGVKPSGHLELSTYFAVKLDGFAKLDEPFEIDKILKNGLLSSVRYASEHKNEIEYLLKELTEGKGLVRVSFTLWLLILSFRNMQNSMY